MNIMKFKYRLHHKQIALPVIRQRQICDIVQSLEGLRTDMTDVVTGYKQVSRVSRDASRNVPQIFRNTFDRQSGFGTLAPGRAHRCARGAHGAQQPKNNRTQSTAKHGENSKEQSAPRKSHGTTPRLIHLPYLAGVRFRGFCKKCLSNPARSPAMSLTSLHHRNSMYKRQTLYFHEKKEVLALERLIGYSNNESFRLLTIGWEELWTNTSSLLWILWTSHYRPIWG